MSILPAQHFLEDYLIEEQSASVKSAAVLVSELRRVGKDGHGVWHIDAHLRRQYNGAEAGGGDGVAHGFSDFQATSPITK